MNLKQLIETVEDLFSKRITLMTLWQEIAENFYPERADFTFRRDTGDQFAEYLSTSYPIVVRRDLGDQLGVMLRPTSKSWFHMVPTDTTLETHEAKSWLQWAEGLQKRAMYDRKTRFSRATKEGDHDFATFGQTAISVRLNREANALLYRCWHLRDMAWLENENGEITIIARRWKPYAKDLQRIFRNKNHPSLTQKADRSPFEIVECYHIVVEQDLYDDNSRTRPFWSIYYDKTHDHLLEAIPVWNKEYVIPRWQTVSGSQYAYSPATITALPDARVIQAMTYTLLEAGEKATNPPLVATQDAVRSDVSIYAGGITWVSEEYDERLGEALRPLSQDLRGLPIGIDMQRDSRAMLRDIFFLNKLALPQRGPEMTAYEIGQRVQEYIRGAIPIFEPMEMEYNGAICELTFDTLMRAGTFGNPVNIPHVLRGADIQFRFESPLHDAVEQQKGQLFMEAKEMLVHALAIDRSSGAVINAVDAIRDTLTGIGVPAKWMNSEEQVRSIQDRQRQTMDMQQMLQSAEQGSKAVANVSRGEKDMAQA